MENRTRGGHQTDESILVRYNTMTALRSAPLLRRESKPIGFKLNSLLRKSNLAKGSTSAPIRHGSPSRA